MGFCVVQWGLAFSETGTWPFVADEKPLWLYHDMGKTTERPVKGLFEGQGNDAQCGKTENSLSLNFFP